MSRERPTRIVGDVSDLPDSASGSRHLVWWGNAGFMTIEGIVFFLAAGVYLYVLGRSDAWPPSGRPPDLFWSTFFTIALALSQLPNIWVLRRARQQDARGVRIGTWVMTAIGVGLAALRWEELQHLNAPWYVDAYGSVVWLLMVLHTSHVVTDLGDTAVLAWWLSTHEIDGNRFADVETNALYWTFVVAAWMPIYALVYWLPRLT